MRYRAGKPTRGPKAWLPLSEQYAREFRIWRGLYTRRYDPYYKHLDPLYDEDVFWDFECFLQEVGGVCPQDGMSIDRIDNARGYVKGNLRWATQQEQLRDRVWPDPVWMYKQRTP